MSDSEGAVSMSSKALRNSRERSRLAGVTENSLSSNCSSSNNSESDQQESSDDERAPPEQEPAENFSNDTSDCDYDSENEQNNTTHIKKRRKKNRCISEFIVDEAEVDSDPEDEDDWEDGAQESDMLLDIGIDESWLTARDIERRRRKENMRDTSESDELLEYLTKKYAHGESASERYFGEGDQRMSEEITQQSLLPKITDPNLWLVKCKVGEERNSVLLLMRKFLTYQATGDSLQIKSVVAHDCIKGFVYIEAFKQCYVKSAIEGISSLKMGIINPQMVSINEMTDVFRVVKKQSRLKSGQWVRLKNGQYKDDIAQVEYLLTDQNKVQLKLLPRIDYTKRRYVKNTTKSEPMEEDRKRKRRPDRKPFDPNAVRAIGGKVIYEGDFFKFERNRYSRDGFLFKNFSLSAIIEDRVKPTLLEIEQFGGQRDEMDVELPTENDDGVESHEFRTGDNVEVCKGELTNLQGKIVSINGNTITFMPKHDVLKDNLVVQASELRKVFKVGDHVRVLSGRYMGETGLIVRITDDRVVLISELTMDEMETLPKDLQVCTGSANGVHSRGKFELGDLVSLDTNTAGVIVRLERESVYVLNVHGTVVSRHPSSLQKRQLHHFNAALDANQNSIQRKDLVEVIDGPHLMSTGEIKHLYKSFVFLYSKLYSQNGGIFVCNAKYVQLIDAEKSPPAGQPKSPVRRSPIRHIITNNQRDRGGKGGFSSPHQRTERGRFNHQDRSLIGKTIIITRGGYKGNVGIVKDANEKTVTVELHSSCHTIFVNKSHIADASSSTRSDERFSSYQRTPDYHSGTRTPIHDDDNDTLVDESEWKNRRALPVSSRTKPPYNRFKPPRFRTRWD